MQCIECSSTVSQRGRIGKRHGWDSSKAFVGPESWLTLLYSRSTGIRVGCTIGGLQDKPWSQVCFLFHSGTRLHFIAQRVQHSHVSALYGLRIASNFADSRSRTFGL